MLVATVEPPDVSHRGFDAVDFRSLASALAIVVFGEIKIPGEQFVDSEPVVVIVAGILPAVGEPFSKQPVVFGDAGRAVVGPEVEIAAIEGDDRLACASDTSDGANGSFAWWCRS